MRTQEYKINKVWPIWLLAVPVCVVSIMVIAVMGYLAFFQFDVATSNNLNPGSMLAVTALFMYPLWISLGFIIKKNYPKNVVQMGTFLIGVLLATKVLYPVINALFPMESQSGLLVILASAFLIQYFASKYIVSYCLEKHE